MSFTGFPSVLTKAVPAERTGAHSSYFSSGALFLQKRLPHNSPPSVGTQGPLLGYTTNCLSVPRQPPSESLRPLPISSEYVQAGRRGPYKRTSLMQVLTLFCPASNTVPTLSFPCRGSFHNTEEKYENIGHKGQSYHHHPPLSTLAFPSSPPTPSCTCAPQHFPLAHASPIHPTLVLT